MFTNTRYKASVIIPTYNRAKLLRLTLESLIYQTLSKEEFEVIIVDDGSNDETKDIVASYEQLLNIKYVYQCDNGFRVARARNLGVVLSEAPVCIFFDSGLLIEGKCLEEHLLFHTPESQSAVIGYVFGFSQENNNSSIIEKKLDVNNLAESITEFMCNSELHDIRDEFYRKYGDNLADLPAPWTFFWTANVSVPTNLIKSVKGFDENFTSWGGEDTDLGYALFRMGAHFHLSRKSISIHYPHEKNRTERKNSSKQNRIYIHSKYNTKETELLLSHRCLDINDVLLQNS